MQPCVIFDVDGTLVDVSGVRHYVTDDPLRKDFESFHAAASFCPPIESTLLLVRAFASLPVGSVSVFIVTARKERWRFRTSMWLRKYGIAHDGLLMRGDNDNRRDVEVKRDILGHIRDEGFDPILAVDDNPAVIELWQSENIPTAIVPGWDHTTTTRRA